MKRTVTMALLCLGLVAAGGVVAGTNPKLAPEVAAARKAGIPPGALGFFLSQADGAQFSLGITKDILNCAIETQKAGAPGNQLLLKASEGVAKSIAHLHIAATVCEQGTELQKIAKSLPKNLSAHARSRVIMEKFWAAHPARDKT